MASEATYLAVSGRREGDTPKTWWRESPVVRKAKGSQRQQVSRAPQPDCALNNDRMSASRRFQYRVFAALQPIANHIHRPADYPMNTPVSLLTEKTLSAISAHPA